LKKLFLQTLTEKTSKNGKTCIHFSSTDSDNHDDNLILMSGENASGKSIVCRMLARMAAESGIEHLEVSMGDRNGKNPFDKVRDFARYGEECAESTGYLTFQRILKDRKRLIAGDKDFVFTIDEAELGLSEEYHKALGQFIAETHIAFAETGRCKMFLVCSHSKTLLNGILAALNSKPSSLLLSLSGCSTTLYEWLAMPVQHRTIDELLSLPSRAAAKRTEINDFRRGA
jgi:hypothetical protein